MRIRNSHIRPLLSILLLVVLAGCGPTSGTDKKIDPTTTPVTAKVPEVGKETPIPEPVYPPASKEDIAFIRRSLVNTSAASVDRLHFIMSYSWTGFNEGTTEGDYIYPDQVYQRSTQDGQTEETLMAANKYYCKDATGKWIVLVEDWEAQIASNMATAEAEMQERWEEEGHPATPPITLNFPTPVRETLTDQLPLYGSVDIEYLEFEYAGEETVEGIVTKRFIGIDNLSTNLPPGAEIVNSTDTGSARDRTLTLWIDPVKEQVRQLETRSHIESQDYGPAVMIMDTSYYGCGVATPTGIPPTPTPYEWPDEMTMINTIIYSKINDPSVVLPTP